VDDNDRLSFDGFDKESDEDNVLEEDKTTKPSISPPDKASHEELDQASNHFTFDSNKGSVNRYNEDEEGDDGAGRKEDEYECPLTEIVHLPTVKALPLNVNVKKNITQKKLCAS